MSSKRAFDRITDGSPVQVLKKPDPKARLPRPGSPSQKPTGTPDNGAADQPAAEE
jgi:hypothetical protein